MLIFYALWVQLLGFQLHTMLQVNDFYLLHMYSGVTSL